MIPQFTFYKITLNFNTAIYVHKHIYLSKCSSFYNAPYFIPLCVRYAQFPFIMLVIGGFIVHCALYSFVFT